MRFDGNERKPLYITSVTNVDPASGTLVLAIDDTEYPCTWDAAATEAPTGTWTRPAHTGYFAGPDVPVGQIAGAPLLTRGVHRAELRVTIGSSIIASEVESIQVV